MKEKEKKSESKREREREKKGWWILLGPHLENTDMWSII
jgi:hypothetical protein